MEKKKNNGSLAEYYFSVEVKVENKATDNRVTGRFQRKSYRGVRHKAIMFFSDISETSISF